VEEAPSSLLTPEVRARMGAVVVKAMKEIGYETAGTLEFLVDRDGKFFALEVNTRIQVEHTVTEMISGFDIIRKMYKIAAGDRLTLRQQDVLLRGHAIQCRINAEDPKNGFAPSFGRITFLRQISGPCSRRSAPWGRTGRRRSSGCGGPFANTRSGASARRSPCCGGSWTRPTSWPERSTPGSSTRTSRA
jgi:acetyl/propionyl-CoA carboxylase alpha subunit